MWTHQRDTLQQVQEKTLALDDTHQKAFDEIKRIIACDVTLAHPDYSIPFEIYTDASSRQLGVVNIHNNRPIAYFSRKRSEMQRNYSVTELELLSIVEILKEFKGILWGQRIKIFTDQKPYAGSSRLN